jgi:hypothetical protein
LAGVTFLINSAYEDKTLLIAQTNCIIKAAEDKKTTKMWKRTADM